ncbi:mariner Mos1 transposase [Trichonephila clavipes]|nr:mariner Mos1 transposase [Trichonephila clavipes]
MIYLLASLDDLSSCFLREYSPQKTQVQGVQEKLHEKRPAPANSKNVILLHDNPRPHTAKVTQENVLELGWSVLLHTPYSPDHSPTDYHLFCSLQKIFGGKTFNSEEQITQAVENFFQFKPATFYKEGIYKLPGRWEKISPVTSSETNSLNSVLRGFQFNNRLCEPNFVVNLEFRKREFFYLYAPVTPCSSHMGWRNVTCSTPFGKL